MKLKLIEKVQETNEVWSFKWEKPEGFNFQAGQFLRYTFPHPNPDERGINRFFTISASPQESFLMLTTRFSEKKSSFKQNLLNLNPRQEVEAKGPNGQFTYPDSNPKAIFIAGGIGITPFRSMLLDLDFKNLNPNITLVYANRNSQIAFKELFDQLVAKHNNLKILYTIDQAEPKWPGLVGKIDSKLIQDQISDYKDPNLIFYISGPEPMVETLAKMLEAELNIPKSRIKLDFFPGYLAAL